MKTLIPKLFSIYINDFNIDIINMIFTIRKANKKDEKIICDLFFEMLRTIYNTDDVQGYEEGYLDNFFSDGENVIYVAEIEGEIVGYISVEVHREDRVFIYIDDFSVSKEYRGNGIGNALLNEAEKYALSLSIPVSSLHVEKSNERALNIKSKNGYKVFEDQENRLLLIKAL